MKVLYLIDSLQGYGAETSLVEITIRFKNIEPVFVQIYEGDQLKKNLEENNISVYSLNLTGKYSFCSAEKEILRIIEKESPKIIHSTLFRSDILARRIKKKLPHIFLVGSLVNNSYSYSRLKQMKFQRRIKHFFIKEWDKYTSKYVDFFIANSEAIIEPNVHALKIKREKIKTIYRGRDTSIFSKKKMNLKSLPFVKKGAIIFLNISRLEERKGQKDLIKAFSSFLYSEPKALLIIAGEGPERKNLETLIEILNIRNSVFLLGYRQDIAELLKVADFFVFPTYFEGLPGALIEAVLSKTPVIASDIPENKECLAPNSALLFTPGNIDEITNSFLRAMGSLDWSRKTEAAFKYAKERFDIDQVSIQYEEFYLRICK